MRYHGTKAHWVLDAWTGSWLAPAFANGAIDEDLRCLGCPLLVMHGDRNEYGSPAHQQRIAALVPTSAHLVLCADCDTCRIVNRWMAFWPQFAHSSMLGAWAERC
jgi:hypothetical protein